MKMTIALVCSDLIEIMLPANGFDLAVIDRKTYFYDEIQAMKSWTLKSEEMKNINQNQFFT
jgi:hypothetical protein